MHAKGIEVFLESLKRVYIQRKKDNRKYNRQYTIWNHETLVHDIREVTKVHRICESPCISIGFFEK